jgi:hypothetical protein
MPHSYAPQFRAMVVDQVRSGLRVAEVADFGEVVLGHLLGLAVDDVEPCFGEALGAHIAAYDGPFVVLFS